MAGLFDTEYHERKIKEYQPPLSKLDKVINWEFFREPIESALYVEPKGAGGRPSFDKIMMFKILILQKYYNLSDEQTEFQINDRTSFKQFLGLKIGSTVPDEKTLWHFKERLAETGLSENLFNLFAEQLITQGIVAREGSMVDASFVDVPRQRNSREDNKTIKDGNIPESFKDNQAKLSQKDTDARWMTKSGERHYGYKDHINADAKTKLITKYSVSSAVPHDSTELENIISEDDNILYADSAYRSQKIEDELKQKNIISHVHEKGYRNNPLDEQ